MDSNVIFPELPTYVGVPSLSGALSVILVLVLPVLAGLFMRLQWSALAKGLVLLGFSALKAFVEAWIVASDSNTAFDFGQAAYSVGVQWVLAVAIYFGLLRGTNVQQAAIEGGVIPSRAQRRVS